MKRVVWPPPCSRFCSRYPASCRLPDSEAPRLRRRRPPCTSRPRFSTTNRCARMDRHPEGDGTRDPPKVRISAAPLLRRRQLRAPGGRAVRDRPRQFQSHCAGEANRAQASAAVAGQSRCARFEPLAAQRAISQQELDNARSRRRGHASFGACARRSASALNLSGRASLHRSAVCRNRQGAGRKPRQSAIVLTTVSDVDRSASSSHERAGVSPLSECAASATRRSISCWLMAACFHRAASPCPDAT